LSYARFSDNSDVYIFLNTASRLECCGCMLQEREFVVDDSSPLGFLLVPTGKVVATEFVSTSSLLAHLDVHRAAGHKVNDHVYEDLRADAVDNDATMRAAQSL